MADRTRDVIYGLTGQIIDTYPPEWAEGVPSSATCSVFDGDRSSDDTADFTPTVTIDSVSTTVDVASGYSQTQHNKLSIAATTSIVVGRQYLAENTYGQREIVTPKYIASGDYLELENDLAYDYPVTTSTLKGLRMTFPIDATWVATESNILAPTSPPYRAVMAYTVNSIVRRHYLYLRLVRQTAKHGVTIEDLRELWPDLSLEEFKETRGQQFAYAIEAAYDRVRIDIITAGYKPEQFRDTEIIDELVRAKTLNVIARMGIAPSGRDLETWVIETRDDYEKLFTRTVSATLKPYIDEGTEGAITVSPMQQLWFRR